MQVHGLQDPFDDPAAVVGVEVVEAGPQPRDLGFRAQLTDTQAVERPNPVRGYGPVQSDADASRHLASRLVGEGHD